jgi:hypothetical protein
MNQTLRSSVAVLVVGSVTAALASEASIGMITSPSTFSLNSATVNRSASLLNGMQVRTSKAPSQIVLDGGALLNLTAGSAGQVFRSRFRLDGGAARLDKVGENGMTVETQMVVVRPVDATSKVDVAVAGSGKQVGVSVRSGEARVTNLQGVEVAHLFAGEALNFSLPAPAPVPQAGASSSMKLSGCVEKVMVEGKSYYFLTDATTKTKVQLQGTEVENLSGKVVQVEGSPNTTVTPVRGASQVMVVVKVISEKKMAGCPVAGGGFWARPLGAAPLVLLGGLVVGGGTIAGLAIADAGPFASSGALAGGQVSVP